MRNTKRILHWSLEQCRIEDGYMIKVFLVEDEIVIREAIGQMVPWNEYGFELVGEAKDGEMALPMIQKEKPQVIITDIKMPFMDGLTLTKLVKKELPDTKIIIVSGYDDFEYAKQAISLGVEQYLLKPITKQAFIEALEKVREKFEKENSQKVYIEKFQNEMKEYEKNSRRDLFDMLVSGNYSLTQIYDKAERHHMDIMAGSYNLVLFSQETSKNWKGVEDNYSENAADLQTKIDTLFHNQPNELLFRNQLFSYAVLVKGEENQIEQLTKQCVEKLQTTFEQEGEQIQWFICAGEAVNRLSQLPDCYKEAMKKFAYRYMGYSRVFQKENNEDQGNEDVMNVSEIDAGTMNPEVIHNFLCKALESEVVPFVKNYLQMIGENALHSRMFRQYVLLNVHFCAVSFIQQLGYDKKDLGEQVNQFCMDNKDELYHLEELITEILAQGIHLREENCKNRYVGVIRSAVEYMQEHFADEDLTLNTVACVANVSANHFSAMFSKEMKQTFIEYLTKIRMEKAKEYLACTDMRSGEIALEVGYKDSHYFSFLFKKTQGCTPSEYRNRGTKG